MRPGQPGAAEPSSGTLLSSIWCRRSSVCPGPEPRNPPLWIHAPSNKRDETIVVDLSSVFLSHPDEEK